jgi:transcriptional regulator with XRE-family HTH domain
MATGVRIRTLRAAAKMTQSELASRLAISPSAVGRYEQGRRQPDPEVVLKLCRMFDTTADWLLFGAGPARVQPGDPMDVDALLEKWRAELTSHAGRLFHKTAEGRRFPLTAEQLDRLWQAVRVASAVALDSDGPL